MRLNKLDYIILIKSFNDNNLDKKIRLFIKASRDTGYELVYLAEAFEKVFPDKELPDVLKEYFEISYIANISLYICDFILNKNEKPPVWAINAFFKTIEYNKRITPDDTVSSKSSDVIDYYLSILNFDDIDIRFFYYLSNWKHYHHMLYRLDKKVNLEKNKNNPKIKKILDLPIYLDYNRMHFLLLIKQIFEDMYDVVKVLGDDDKTPWALFGNALKNTGTLDKWITHAIEKHNIRKPLIDAIMSLGIEYEKLPDSLKEDKVKKESFSFKSNIMR
jgi:hypothetical protein